VPYVNLYNQITFLPVKEITKMISHNLIKRKNVGLGAVKEYLLQLWFVCLFIA